MTKSTTPKPTAAQLTRFYALARTYLAVWREAKQDEALPRIFQLINEDLVREAEILECGPYVGKLKRFFREHGPYAYCEPLEKCEK